MNFGPTLRSAAKYRVRCSGREDLNLRPPAPKAFSTLPVNISISNSCIFNDIRELLKVDENYYFWVLAVSTKLSTAIPVVLSPHSESSVLIVGSSAFVFWYSVLPHDRSRFRIGKRSSNLVTSNASTDVRRLPVLPGFFSIAATMETVLARSLIL